MILEVSLLVTLVKLVDSIPLPPPPSKRGRGKPRFYPDRLFLKALVIMIVGSGNILTDNGSNIILP